MKWAINNKIIVGFGVTLAILVINAIVTYSNTIKAINSSYWVSHTNEVLAALEGTLSTLKDAETGQRGYIITGKENFLEPYNTATNNVNGHLEQLKQLTADNPNQQRRIAVLEKNIASQLNYLQQVIALRRKQGFEATQQVVLSEQGKQEMDQIRALVAQMITYERQLLRLRIREERNSVQQTIVTFSIASGLSLALVGLVFYLVQRDIDQRSKAEKTLRQSEARFRRLAESNIIGVTFADLNGNIIYANDAFLHILGYTQEDVVSGRLNWQQITAPEYRARDERAFLQAQKTGSCPPFEKEFIHKDGSLVPALIGVALIEEFNTPLCLSFTLDLTNQKAAEAEILQLNDTLEQRVQKRTTQLEEANQELQAFAYSVSHDLRAPLRGMQGFSQALLEDYGDKIDNQGQEYVRRIVAGASRMEDLIQDLLSYSRLSRAELRLQRLDLSNIVMEAMTQIESELKQREAQVKVEHRLHQVMAHYSTLVQMVANLLSNAIKFVPDGVTPKVRVWAEEQGDWVRLWVEDNGIGIEPEYHQRIFRVFERLHGIESYPGTGIGLAIVRKGAERLGAKVGVESQIGQGSRFWIELPRAN